MPKSFTPEMNKKLRPLTIKIGSHAVNSHEFCIMEAVAYIAGEPHSGTPVCVSDTISEFMMFINDTRKDDKERNKLKKVVPDIIGTRPTLMTKDYIVNAQGEDVVIEVEIPRPTKGYLKAEKRRNTLLLEAIRTLGVSIDETYADEPIYDAGNIHTKDAMEIVKKLAAVKNKA